MASNNNLLLAEEANSVDLSLSAEAAAIIEEGIVAFRSGDLGISLEEFDGHMAETTASLKRKKAAAKPFARG